MGHLPAQLCICSRSLREWCRVRFRRFVVNQAEEDVVMFVSEGERDGSHLSRVTADKLRAAVYTLRSVPQLVLSILLFAVVAAADVFFSSLLSTPRCPSHVGQSHSTAASVSPPTASNVLLAHDLSSTSRASYLQIGLFPPPTD